MRKITILSMISMDGVLQAPGGPKEDTSGGFEYGGWTATYSDEDFGKKMMEEMSQPADYLLGRKTFQIWADYWPEHGDFWPNVNTGTKYVFSEKLQDSDPLISGWKHSAVVNSVDAIKTLKGSPGNDIQVWGSSELIQLLLKNDLVDELRLKIYPLTLGKGKRLFSGGALPAAFTLTDSSVTSKGVILANYKRAGDVVTGSVE